MPAPRAARGGSEWARPDRLRETLPSYYDKRWPEAVGEATRHVSHLKKSDGSEKEYQVAPDARTQRINVERQVRALENNRAEAISKRMGRLLRHAASKRCVVDSAGFAPLATIVEDGQLKNWKCTEEDALAVVSGGDKVRFEAILAPGHSKVCLLYTSDAADE